MRKKIKCWCTPFFNPPMVFIHNTNYKKMFVWLVNTVWVLTPLWTPCHSFPLSDMSKLFNFDTSLNFLPKVCLTCQYCWVLTPHWTPCQRFVWLVNTPHWIPCHSFLLFDLWMLLSFHTFYIIIYFTGICLAKPKYALFYINILLVLTFFN